MGEVVVSSEEMGLKNMETEESSVVKWERFLPRMSLRVLLVEADDSTRHIISALLRKCSYKVASVADGLKAWEILKARPNEIDLILTEVDLPSVSGFALLTLIMEHEICKNIPVIMMSSHDSVSTVYSCMLRGAADYLVKPIRRNELRNLWQHVWRRQSQASAGGNYIQMESEAEKKVEGTSENNAACNDSSSYTGSAQRNVENADEGSEAGGGASVELQNVEPESEGRDGNIASEASDNNDELVNAGREVIDLIGAFNDHQKDCSYKNTNTSSASNFDSCPQLDLSLKRSHPGSGFEVQNHGTEKRRVINHSDASAFSLYTNRPQKHILPAQTSDHIRENESEAAVSTSQRMVFAVPVPVREVKFNSIRSNYGPVLPSEFCTQSVALPGPSPSSANHKEPAFQGSSEQKFDQRRVNVSSCTNQNMDRGLEECRQINNGNTDQSGSNSFYNGATSHLHSIGYGSISVSNSNVDHVAAGESKNEEGLCGSSHRSLQREAALNKFRLKRKDRCFEKKVRYESRKKLAEQRPRVKGQFVRHVQSDVTPVESEN